MRGTNGINALMYVRDLQLFSSRDAGCYIISKEPTTVGQCKTEDARLVGSKTLTFKRRKPCGCYGPRPCRIYKNKHATATRTVNGRAWQYYCSRRLVMVMLFLSSCPGLRLSAVVRFSITFHYKRRVENPAEQHPCMALSPPQPGWGSNGAGQSLPCNDGRVQYCGLYIEWRSSRLPVSHVLSASRLALLLTTYMEWTTTFWRPL